MAAVQDDDLMNRPTPGPEALAAVLQPGPALPAAAPSKPSKVLIGALLGVIVLAVIALVSMMAARK